MLFQAQRHVLAKENQAFELGEYEAFALEPKMMRYSPDYFSKEAS
jgi:hypothetical protein